MKRRSDRPRAAGTVGIALIAAAAVVVNVACFSVAAYMIHQDRAENNFTVGYCRIEIQEDFVPPDKLEPGSVIYKKVIVKNTGTTDCGVRVLVSFSDSAMEALTETDINWDSWEDRGDGYYYYKGVLEPGQLSEPVFTTITVKADAQESQIKDFQVMVYGESKNAEGDGDYTDIVWD